MSLARALEGIATPLDAVRQAVFGWALRRPLLPSILVRRERRLAAIASLHAALALALVVCFPVLVFALGPVLLGVAHVAADVRYLVLRRALERWWRTAIWFGSGALLALRLGEEIGLFGSGSRPELALGFAWMALALVAGARAAGSYRRAALAAPLLALGCCAALAEPLYALMAFVHLHNLVALVVWASLFQRRLRSLLLPLLVVAGAASALCSGALHGVVAEHGSLEAFGLGLYELSGWLAPGLPEKYAVGLTLSYVFLQSVHYAIWLIVIPQSDSGTQGTLTFRMSARALLRDFGGAPLVALILCALVVMGAALFHVHETRRVYLSLAMFHVYMEFALLAYFWARGGAAQGGVKRSPAAARSAAEAAPARAGAALVRARSETTAPPTSRPPAW